MRRGWRSFIGPSRPHFMSEFGLWEVPVSVSPGLRLPMVGTFVLSGPLRLAQQAAVRGFLHLELHGIDLADPGSETHRGDGYDRALCARQPELKVSLDRRRDRLRELITVRGGATSIVSAFGGA